ncbi:organic cation/carnitine transporter 3-like [Coffea arabica]|uniref:Organic cation/carnitine transporter 3-like n=1 Tax=Coffea arabica TaxID=13443 RepID=A0A6P6TSA1_COFAR|nr:organic cation/carnitine transporter 3-like [Coffea arabica]
MTDPAPLILRSSSSSSSVVAAEASLPSSGTRTSTLDDTIERCIGDYFGWTQFLRAILISLAWAFDAQQTFITVFTDVDPTWHCTRNNTTNICSSSSQVCLLPDEAWSWDLPPYTSTISEWSLQCAGSFLAGLPASSFFAGCLAGGFVLATLADSYLGRKKLLVLSCLLMSISGLLTALVSTNVWIYTALRFLCGFGRASVGTCALVLATEMVGKRWRAHVGMIGFLFFTLGFLSLPLMAYLNRGSSWRVLYFWSCAPTVLYSILVHFFAYESPRWLYVRGRKQEFLSTLKSIATVPTPQLLDITSSCFSNNTNSDSGTTGCELDIDDATRNAANFWNSSSYYALWEKPWAFRRLAAVMAIGFGTGMVYYGMPLGLGNLSFNLYLSVTLNALSEFPAAFMTFFLIATLNRKGLVLGLSVASGVCSCLIIVVEQVINSNSYYYWWRNALQMVLELASFFSACTGFNVLMIFTLELFPTSVRNSALSMVRQAVVFGGLFSPLLVAAGRNGLLSYGVFGVTIAVSGLFVGCLPETRGAALCDTLDEQEHKETLAFSAKITQDFA